MLWLWITLGLVALVVAYDLTQRHHTILRNFPIIGHFRYMLEAVGPELRQYIVTNNDEERPFSRDERAWVYASAKKQNNYFGFGTDNNMEHTSSYLLLKHAAFPYAPPFSLAEQGYAIPCAKVLGGFRGREKAFRPASAINISGMSYGSLSGAAVEALNRGAKLAGCLHNTGEGGLAPYHDHGAELVWQIGTGYFGCRDAEGRFDIEQLVDKTRRYPVRALEIKLSQGAKPGLGGVLPAAKISREIAQIRGIPRDRDCVSPPGHTEFHDVDGMLDFVERLAARTGLPVGIKSAVGDLQFWVSLADAMQDGQRGVDFITIDGGEGGTGAGPLAFTDHVALPFYIGFSRVYRIFAERNMQDRVVFIGSGRLGFPDRAMLAFGLGCDLINVGREGMLAVGCIQAQRCHTGHCPTGVATQNPWLTRGLDPTSKSVRLANYVTVLRKELLELAHAVGVAHPGLVRPAQLEVLDEGYRSTPVDQVFGYRSGWGATSPANAEQLVALLERRTQSGPAETSSSGLSEPGSGRRSGIAAESDRGSRGDDLLS